MPVRLSAALLAAAALAAAEPQQVLSLRADLAALRGGPALAPLLADPQAAAARARLLGLAAFRDGHPGARWPAAIVLSAAEGLAADAWMPDADGVADPNPSWMLAVALPQAPAAAGPWLQRRFALSVPPAAPANGGGAGESWALAAGALALASGVGPLAEPPAPLPDGAVLTVRWNLRPVVELVQLREEEGAHYYLDPILPGWRSATPCLSTTVAVAKDRWSTRLDLTGAGPLPGHALDPAFAALVDGRRMFALAVGLEPGAVAQVVRNFTPPAVYRDLGTALGGSPGALANLLSGDVLVEIEPGAPLPQVAVALGLRPGADPGAALTAAAASASAASLARAGGSDALVFPSPLGQVQVAWRAGRLVAASDPAALERLLAAAPAAAATAPALVAHGDLGRLARQLLPLATLGLGSSGTATAANRLDAACLPPLPVAMRHLGAWSARGRLDATGLHVEEDGLPLLAALANWGAWYAAVVHAPQMLVWHRAARGVGRPRQRTEF